MLTSALLRTTVLTSLGLALTACSGGASGGASPAASASATSPDSTPAASATSAAPASQEQVVADFCADRDDLTDLGTQIEAGGLPAAIQQLPAFVQRMDAMQPPDAVADDFAAYRDAWRSIADAMAGGSVDDPALQAEVEAAVAAHPDAQAVEDRLKAWDAANCPASTASPSAG